MTKTQVENRKNLENKRHNEYSERENARHNVETERETKRSNKRNESLSERGQGLGILGDIIKGIFGLGSAGIKAAANDPMWYTKVGPLTKDSASLPFGRAIYRPLVGATKYQSTESVDFTPGIMVIDCALTIGNPQDDFSSINVAGTKAYTAIRSFNAGSAEGLPPDYIKYLMGMRSNLAVFSTLYRAYAISRQYSSENRYIGRAMLMALGFDPDSIYSNQAQLRFTINRLALKCGVLAIPSNYTLFARTAWMFSSIFKDSDSDKAQLIAYRLDGHHRYNDDAGTLRWLPWDDGIDVMDMCKELEADIDAMLESEFVWIQSGDIMKAFGNTALFKLPYLEEGVNLQFGYSAEVLDQIHNLSAPCGGYVISENDPIANYNPTQDALFGSFDIYENLAGRIVQGYNAFFSGNSDVTPQIILAEANINSTGFTAPTDAFMSGDDKVILDTYKPGQPTPEDVLVATRMTVPVKVQGPSGDDIAVTSTMGLSMYYRGNNHTANRYVIPIGDPLGAQISTYYIVKSCGSEVPVGISIHTFIPSGTGDVVLKSYCTPLRSTLVQATTAANAYSTVGYMHKAEQLFAAWHYAPRRVYNVKLTSSTSNIVTAFEINNAVFIASDTCSPMHDCALYSEFSVGEIAGFTSIK